MMRVSVGLVLAAVVLICNEASSQPQTLPQCPASEQTFGICTYDPNVNCLDQSQCPAGELCCSNGCNKICKKPVMGDGRDELKPIRPPSSKGMQCPKPSSSGSFGICSFDKSVNCLDDSQCNNGQMCCSEGCNKICKDPVSDSSRDEEQKPTRPPGIEIKNCPKPSGSGSFGICSFDESVNCLDDSQCTNGQMCCSEGCNKVCKEPVTFQPIKPEPKVPGMQVNKAKGSFQ